MLPGLLLALPVQHIQARWDWIPGQDVVSSRTCSTNDESWITKSQLVVVPPLVRCTFHRPGQRWFQWNFKPDPNEFLDIAYRAK